MLVAIAPIRLEGLDLLMALAFLALVAWLGLSAKSGKGMMQYLAAGRALTLPMFVATLVSTWYGGILGVGESVGAYGLGTWVILGVPYYVFAILYALFLARRVREGDQISIPERFAHRFGPVSGLVSAVLLFLLAVPAAHVLMLGKLVQVLTGWELAAAVSVGALAGTLFLVRGGLFADVRMSLVAFVAMYIGFGAIAGYCLMNHPPVATWQKLARPEMLTWHGGAGWGYLVSFFILGAWTLADPAFHQRVAAAASPEVGRKGLIACVACWFVFDILSITVAMYALSLLKSPPSDALLLYPVFGDQVLPAGLRGLFYCGMTGTILTATVGYTLVSGATWGREIICRLRKDATDDQVRNWTRAGLFIALAIAIGLALQITSVVQLWYAWAGAFVGALVLPLLISYRSTGPVLDRWVASAMILASGVSLGWLVYGKTHGNDYLEAQWFGQPVSVGTILPGLAASALILSLGQAASKRRPSR